MAERVKQISGHLSTASRPAEIQPAPTSGGVGLATSSYDYTLNNNVLTPEQRRSYEENGFMVVKNCVPRDKLAIYRDRFKAICEGKVNTRGMIVMRDVAIAKTEFVHDQKAITKIQDWQDDEVLSDYLSLPEVLKYVRCFTGDNVMAMHTMLINKPPDPGTKTSRHPMHQDLHYFPFRPANRIVCAWTAMEKVHRGNGCLVVVPGTHKGELLEHEYPEWEGGVNKMYHGVKGWNPENKRIWVEMEEGDTVFFHPILLHGSGANTSQGFRKAISCHYAASDCNYIDVGGSSQQLIEDEIRELAARRMSMDLQNVDLKLKDVWKMKCRLVAGKEINL